MILSLIIITIAYYWLLRETDFLRCNLRGDNSIELQCNEHREHTPQIEPCRIINALYPKVEPIKLLTEVCYLTRIQNEMKGSKYQIDYHQMQPCRTESYQVIYIGGHSISLSAISPKLYDTMAEFQKIADGKDRKPALKFAPINSFNPLCGKEWYNEHVDDVIPEPTIDLVVNGKETHFNGNFRTGCVHEFMVVNAELWERPRIKGKKIKPEPVTA